jgi:hypothetical protein
MTTPRNSYEKNAPRQQVSHTDIKFFEIMNREGITGGDDLAERFCRGVLHDVYDYKRADGSHIGILLIPQHLACEPMISDAVREDVLTGFLRPVFDPNSAQLRDGDLVFGVGPADDRVWLQTTTPDAPDAVQLPRHRENWLRLLSAELSQWTLMYAMMAVADENNTLGSDELEDFYGAPRGSLSSANDPHQIQVKG